MHSRSRNRARERERERERENSIGGAKAQTNSLRLALTGRYEHGKYIVVLDDRDVRLTSGEFANLAKLTAAQLSNKGPVVLKKMQACRLRNAMNRDTGRAAIGDLVVRTVHHAIPKSSYMLGIAPERITLESSIGDSLKTCGVEPHVAEILLAHSGR